jgi:hypothetical protein
MQIKSVTFEEVEEVGDNFLCFNRNLRDISLPKLKVVGEYFLYCIRDLININCPDQIIMGKCFLPYSRSKRVMELWRNRRL